MKYKIFNFFQLVLIIIISYIFYFLKFGLKGGKSSLWLIIPSIVVFAYSLYGVPTSAVRNFWGILELHIGSDFQNRRDFYCKASEAILYAYEKNKEILICTCSIKQKHVLKFFAGAVKFYPLSQYDKIFGWCNNFYYRILCKVHFPYPMIKFVITPEKMTKQQIFVLSSFSEKGKTRDRII